MLKVTYNNGVRDVTVSTQGKGPELVAMLQACGYTIVKVGV